RVLIWRWRWSGSIMAPRRPWRWPSGWWSWRSARVDSRNSAPTSTRPAMPIRRSPACRATSWRTSASAIRVVAFLPANWKPPARITPQWMAKQPLILNGPGTHLSRLTSHWFAEAGQRPTPRMALDYNDAIKSLVAAGYGGTLLPHEAGAQTPDERVVMRPLKPALWRQLGVAYGERDIAPATAHLLSALRSLRQV